MSDEVSRGELAGCQLRCFAQGRCGFFVTLLNPQPLPPAFRYGAAVAAELVRIATTAHVLRVAFEPGDDICPPPRDWPPIPFPWPPEPDPHPWRDDDFTIDYALGLAIALEASSGAWAKLDSAAGLERVHEVAVKTAGAEQVG